MHSDTEPLEFPAIRRALEGECATPYGKEAARSLEPAPSLGIARAFQEAVTAARQGWDAGDGPRLEEQPDIRAAIRQSGRAGASPLSGLALRKIIQVVQTGEYLHRSLARYPALFAGDAGDLTATADLVDRLDGAVDTMGRVRREASETLAGLHDEVASVRGDLEKEVAKKQKDKRIAPGLVEPNTPHYSGPRRVLAVQADTAGRMKGVRREALSRDRGVLVEPMEWIALNNRLEQLNKETDAEERRVLKAVTAEVGERHRDLERLLDAVTWIDLALGAGRLSRKTEATAPELVDEPLLDLRRARHPALVADQAKGGVEAVPLDLAVGPDRPMILITGPNTGGKTVVVKTAGLLATMAYCGLHIPAAAGSRVGGYRRILVDIGDKQDLMHHVSTFAGHVEALNRILAEADDRTLALLDEMGTGTDPEEGAALAMAVLEELAERGTHGVFTTHLSPLKGFADRHAAVTNANMRFDYEALRPTYQLEVGKPGSSLGLVVAERGGLAAPVLERARRHLAELRPEAES